MHHKKIAAALTVVTATSLLLIPQAQAATGLADQKITWQRCFDPVPPGFPPGAERLECGSFTAPMDWHNPRNGKTITIAVRHGSEVRHGEDSGLHQPRWTRRRGTHAAVGLPQPAEAQ
jgi:hypothetical protein